MRILITHELFPPDFTGGGEKLTLKLAKLLKENGNQVKVLTSGNPRVKEYDGIRTIRLPLNRYLLNLGFFRLLKEAKDVDIIQTSSGNVCLSSWLAAKILRKPICCHVHHIFGDYWREVRGPILGRIFQLLERFYLNRSYDAIVFQNTNSKNMGLKIGIDEKKIKIIQPGVEWEEYQVKGIKKEYFVLFVGNFKMNKQSAKIKGLEDFLSASKKLPEVNFVIVGGGEEIDKLKLHYRKNVIFTGSLVGKTLIELYNRAMIFCCCSLTEGFGLSILEAMASGCAIISTVDIGQEGIKIDPESPDQIVSSIKYMLIKKKQTKDIGEKNRKLAKKFTWKKFIQNYLDLYKSLL